MVGSPFSADVPGLLERHLAHLRDGSGLPLDVIRERGYRSALGQKELADLGFAGYQRRVPALLVPVCPPDGSNSLYQVKPDAPRTDQAGKVVKYETPAGKPLRLDVPPRSRPHLTATAVPLWITEGAKKADALAAAGACAVALLGVWSFLGPSVFGEKTFLADFDRIALDGRDVYVVYDSDVAQKTSVRQAMTRLGAMLAARGARPRAVQLPPGPDGAKTGADDFLLTHGLADLKALPTLELVDAPPPPPMTDLGNAQRLVAQHGADVRWCDAMGRWFHWTGVLWEQVGPTILQDLAKETALALYEEAAAATDPEQRVALMKWAKASGAARAISSMVALTKTVRGPIAVDADQLDADPMLLGVENGVVDLRTGRGQPPNRADLITKTCRAPFDPDALCPLWDGFLETIFAGDAEVIAYVQRAAGYSLTGKTGERVIFIEHGSGDNGKTTFLEVLAHVFGTYAMSTPVETLIARKDRGIPNDLARLKSARFVSATETERGAKLAEAFIKAVTGGDRVSARFLHQEFFDFIPQLKLWLATNHRPEVASGGKAIWKRIRLIPFEVKVPANRIDLDLKAKLLAEAPGILAWAVRGCLEWQRIGLKEPASIRDANTRYEEDEDVLGAFLEDRAIVEPAVWCAVADLYAAFAEWAKAHGEEVLSAKAFSQALAERPDIKRARQGGTGKKGFSGVRLLPTPQVKQRKQEDGLDG